jgi:hypothetical protein
MFEELNKAVELEPNKESYLLLKRAYEHEDMQAEADVIDSKLKKMIVPAGRPKRVKRAPKVVI